MGVVDTSPLVPQKDGEGVHEQDGEHALIALNGLRLGGSMHGYTSWTHTEHSLMLIRAHGTAKAD
jgi:hypothetical protein